MMERTRLQRLLPRLMVGMLAGGCASWTIEGAAHPADAKQTLAVGVGVLLATATVPAARRWTAARAVGVAVLWALLAAGFAVLHYLAIGRVLPGR